MLDDTDRDRRRRKRERRRIAQRRYRARYAEGRFAILFEVGDLDEVELLVRLEWLANADRANKKKISEALAAMLKDAAKGG